MFFVCKSFTTNEVWTNDQINWLSGLPTHKATIVIHLFVNFADYKLVECVYQQQQQKKSCLEEKDLGILTRIVYVTDIQIMVRFSKIVFLSSHRIAVALAAFVSLTFLLYHWATSQKWALWIFYSPIHIQINWILNIFMHSLCFQFILTQFSQFLIMMKFIEFFYWIVCMRIK